MHELSIANSILKIVLEEVSSKDLPAVKTIGLKIGVLSGVLPDALEFGFDVLKKETLLKNTKLAIEQVFLAGKCSSCNKKFEINNMLFICPECGSSSINLEQGQELDIAFLEIEENSTNIEQ